MTSQLLIEMPAEGAARLLTLSLLEQLSQYDRASRGADPSQTSRAAETYRLALRRLRACTVLYADALGDSIPRKGRRRLRLLVDAADRLHRADVQLAWMVRYLPASDQRDGNVPFGDGTRAATWLYDRVARRRERAQRLLLRARSQARPIRRITKRLGVYTTPVRLDVVPTPLSFARLTSDRLLAESDAFGAAMRTAVGSGSHPELRRARRAAEHLAYLLDPLRAYTDVEEPSARVARLRGALDRLDDVALVARAIIRAGQRVAALHAGEALRAAIWPRPDLSVGDTDTPGPSLPAPAGLQRGLLVLANALHDEAERAFQGLTATWRDSGGDTLIERLEAIATVLQS